MHGELQSERTNGFGKSESPLHRRSAIRRIYSRHIPPKSPRIKGTFDSFRFLRDLRGLSLFEEGESECPTK
jgi:hypothetical protein